jgi:hypothetical protein
MGGNTENNVKPFDPDRDGSFELWYDGRLTDYAPNIAELKQFHRLKYSSDEPASNAASNGPGSCPMLQQLVYQ